jgi:hypothetical protein
MASFGSDEEHIRDLLIERGHRKWGFVIYRCTYDDDDAWVRFMEIANRRGEDDLTDSDVPELLQTLDWKVHEDRELLDGASKDQVRKHFLSWVASDAAKAEQYDPNRPEWQAFDTMLGLTPRYTYCVHVDAAALHSVVYEAPQPPDRDVRGIGYVNLIDAEWEMPDPATFDFEINGMDPETDDPTDEGEEPIEGCRMTHVGWMKMGAQSMGVSAYAVLDKSGMFYAVYARPPDVWTR